MYKFIMIVFYFILTLLFSSGSFLLFSPQFGNQPEKNKKLLYDSLKNYSDGEFKNQENFVMMTGDMSMSEFMRGDSGRMRPKDIIPKKVDFKSFRTNLTDGVQYIWLGHSAFLVKIKIKL